MKNKEVGPLFCPGIEPKIIVAERQERQIMRKAWHQPYQRPKVAFAPMAANGSVEPCFT